VNHDVAVIEQYPFGFGSAFVSQGPSSRLFEQFLNPIGQGLHVGTGVPGGYHENIGDYEQISDFQQDYVLALLVGDGVCGQPGKRHCVYGSNLLASGDIRPWLGHTRGRFPNQPIRKTMTDLTQLLSSTDITIAVVGATDSPGKYGGIIYRDLKGLGYRVKAVNPNRSMVDGDECYPNLAALAERPEIIDLVVPPKTGLGVAKEAVSLGYGNLWLQPGAEGPSLLAFLEEQHVPHLADSCIMVSSRRVLRGR
jgi:hypothetical protein